MELEDMATKAPASTGGQSNGKEDNGTFGKTSGNDYDIEASTWRAWYIRIMVISY
jgi:hypothetical protein